MYIINNTLGPVRQIHQKVEGKTALARLLHTYKQLRQRKGHRAVFTFVSRCIQEAQQEHCSLAAVHSGKRSRKAALCAHRKAALCGSTKPQVSLELVTIFQQMYYFPISENVKFISCKFPTLFTEI